jgi:diguanylate cyclase (GGDEF)-like protein
VGRLTVSFGVSAHAPNDTLADLYRRADAALYEAKAAGRNRVVMEPAA